VDALMETLVLYERWLRCTPTLMFCLGFDIIEHCCKGERNGAIVEQDYMLEFVVSRQRALFSIFW
jgi:hypothetical protein